MDYYLVVIATFSSIINWAQCEIGKFQHVLREIMNLLVIDLNLYLQFLKSMCQVCMTYKVKGQNYKLHMLEVIVAKKNHPS